MAAYPEVREAAATAQIGDYPEVISLADGGVISLSVDEVIAPQLQPLEDVRAQVEADIEASRLQAAVITYADSLAATITADTDFAALGLTAIDDDGLRSRTFIDRTPAGFIEEVFASDEGAVFVMPYNGGAVLVRLDAINTPDVTSPDLEADRAAQITRLTNSVTDDILTIAQRELRRATEVTIDQNAVNAVLTNLQ
jgi:peptidyl-prolyl cis-trans isomerase D